MKKIFVLLTLTLFSFLAQGSSYFGAGGGGAGMSIGGGVTSGTANSVLFIDALGNLAQDNPAFIYDGTTFTTPGLKVTNTTTLNSSLNGAMQATSGVVSAGTLPLNVGGTGQTTKAAAFDALSPMTTSGDIVYGGASGTGTRLAKGTDGFVLTLASGLPSWVSPSSSATTISDDSTSTGSSVTLPAPTTTIVRLSGFGLASVLKIGATSGQVDGQIVTYLNEVGSTLNFIGCSAGCAANSIYFPGSTTAGTYTVMSNGSVTFLYEGSQSRWTLQSYSPTTSIPGSATTYSSNGRLSALSLDVNEIMVGGGVGVAPSASSTPTLNGLFLEDPGAGTNKVSLVAPTLAGNYTLTFPTGAGSSGQTWTSNGSGTMSFGTLGVVGGGTGIVTGTSGGILGFTGSTTLASSGALTANAIILGGGAGATPSALVSLGTTTTLLHGNAAGAPTFGAVGLTTDVTGLLPLANGGTAANLTAANGGLVYSGASAIAISAAGTSGQIPVSAGAAAPVWTTPNLDNFRNKLLNGNFQFWQRGTSLTIANATSKYQADQWYVKNSLGTNGVITYSRVAAVTDGSAFGASVKITTAPTAAQVNGTELYQVLDQPTSTTLYNKTASFNILVKALGNVNQVGVQFYYATSEVKLTTSIGSEQTCTVNTSTFVNCTISGQALGTSQTTAGVIGVRIRVTGVSSGNTYDLNNGFVAEQGQLNLGALPATFSLAHPSYAAELVALKNFMEVIDSVSGDTIVSTCQAYSTSNATCRFVWTVTKRAIPTITDTPAGFTISSSAGSRAFDSAHTFSNADTRAADLDVTRTGSGLTAGNAAGVDLRTGSIYIDAGI